MTTRTRVETVSAMVVTPHPSSPALYILNTFWASCILSHCPVGHEGKAMLEKSSLRLRDGTTLDELIDVKSHEVSLRVMNDPELHRLEMERIFARTWLLLGHESEIP